MDYELLLMAKVESKSKDRINMIICRKLLK